MNSPRKILFIDKTSDRKERIQALKARGYSVFPALKVEDSRSRCFRGAYDLILVNAGEDMEQALQLCDEIRQQCPQQHVMLSSDTKADRDYVVPADLQTLLEAVDRDLGPGASSTDYASAA